MSSLDTLQAELQAALGDTLRHLVRDRGEITITIGHQDSAAAARLLRDWPKFAFEQLVDLCGIDYAAWRDAPVDGPRFAVVSHLLSLKHNWRVRLKVFCPDDELPMVPTFTEVWNSANWFEREAFDLYGIVFEGHVDLRRILTDYGFIGHPFRKDFPTTGHVEMRYDVERQRVIYQPVTIEPREITPRIIREENYGGLH